MLEKLESKKCKKATGVFKSNFFKVSERTISKSQLWKLDGTVLKNLDEKWTSDEEWIFKTKDDLIYIKNVSKTKVLGTRVGLE